jgi:hypothetical protein
MWYNAFQVTFQRSMLPPSSVFEEKEAKGNQQHCVIALSQINIRNKPFIVHITKRISVTITLQTRIREALGLILGKETSILTQHVCSFPR